MATSPTPHSPLQQFFASVIARDEAERAVEFAKLQAAVSANKDWNAAFDHAWNCIAACDNWNEETLSHNIESNFPDLSVDTCEEIAARALSKAEEQA